MVKDQKDLDNLPLEECMKDMQLEYRGCSVEDRVKRIEPGIRARLRHNRHLPLVSRSINSISGCGFYL